MLNSGTSQGARVFQRFLPSYCVYMQAFQWWALAYLSGQGRREDKKLNNKRKRRQGHHTTEEIQGGERNRY